MSLFQQIRARVVQALDDMASQGQLPEGLNLTAVTVEPPRDPAHGDMATNAAMVLAKGAGQKPRDIFTSHAAAPFEIYTIYVADALAIFY